MLRIGIYDETETYQRELGKWIAAWAGVQSLRVLTYYFKSREDLEYEQEVSGDFHFFLIHLPKGNVGVLKTARALRKQNPFTEMVFLAEDGACFSEIMEIGHVFYLQKPVTTEKLFRTLNRVVEENRLLTETFSFQSGHKSYIISLREVRYFASDRRLIHVYLMDGKEYFFYSKMDELERRLTETNQIFIRIHQSYLINASQVLHYYSTQVTLKNGTILPVSRDRREDFKAYRRYFFAIQ